jgi:hypothetical protein
MENEKYMPVTSQNRKSKRIKTPYHLMKFILIDSETGISE